MIDQTSGWKVKRYWGLFLVVCSAFGLARAADIPSRVQLEDVEGNAALGWVRAQNARTTADLQSDMRYKRFYNEVLKVEQSPQRLALPEQIDGSIYNFWQDAEHPRGIWRVSKPAAFNSGAPEWTTIFDVDRLALIDHADWVFQGAECLEPHAERCLIALSISGEDANTLREFDLRRHRFVPGGFLLPHSKQTAVWVDRESLLVARAWDDLPDSLTKSGYPYIVRLVRRGAPLNQAIEVARGSVDDMSVAPITLRDESGRRLLLIERSKDFFTVTYSRFDPVSAAVTPLALPSRIGFLGYFGGRLVLRLDQDWQAGSAHFQRGSIVAVDPSQPEKAVQTIFVPNSHESTGDIDIGKGGVLAVVYENVQPRLSVFTPHDGKWSEHKVKLPANTSATIVSASVDDRTAYVESQGYIRAPALMSVDTKSFKTRPVSHTPDLFRAADLVTEQYWTHSTDGTAIPYFVVHRRNWHLDGRNPVLFTAYGGFDLSYLPTYYPDLGKTWFERGGVYVVGNIRGGGEFGPAWHEAGMKSGRQRAYDDFASIGRDLFARKITDAAHLAIRGRSNGGLLMGVEFTQHPEMWKAVVIGVPLLDMLNFEHMAAGASWAAEYGRTSVPEERSFLERISPLQALKPDTRYPMPFIFTSTKDDRVGPVHARLFAAKLEAYGKPFYYYEDTEGGHAGTVNAREIAHERALEAVYLTRAVMDKPAH
ncbi:prolyl oligopeptidase family serine peptidase [Acidomonas methanolica]|uniref:prolyl oligopeptidase family serine peptidase n=1 Tax=Acidomonas methanolica TaxID=437 RepID=UPI00211A1500|nr:prolyl oligopeptidase family serine peptidase [Acidomonas methanolica]MCQ9154818.1 S9 family peptidase [Acidomonas methanolica]